MKYQITLDDRNMNLVLTALREMADFADSVDDADLQREYLELGSMINEEYTRPIDDGSEE